MIEDVANNIIMYCKDNDIDISNLKLQKLLFFYQMEYYKQNGELAFDDEFMAFKYGPVNYKIWKKYQENLFVEDVKIIDVKKYINKYINRSNSSLVYMSHTSEEWKNKSKFDFSVMSYDNLKEEWDVQV